MNFVVDDSATASSSLDNQGKSTRQSLSASASASAASETAAGSHGNGGGGSGGGGPNGGDGGAAGGGARVSSANTVSSASSSGSGGGSAGQNQQHQPQRSQEQQQQQQQVHAPHQHQHQQFGPVAVAGPVGTNADVGGSLAAFDITAACDPLHAHVAMSALQPAVPAPVTAQQPQPQPQVWVDVAGQPQQTQQQAGMYNALLQQPQPQQQMLVGPAGGATVGASADGAGSQQQYAGGAAQAPPTIATTIITGPHGLQMVLGPDAAATLLQPSQQQAQAQVSGEAQQSWTEGASLVAQQHMPLAQQQSQQQLGALPQPQGVTSSSGSNKRSSQAAGLGSCPPPTKQTRRKNARHHHTHRRRSAGGDGVGGEEQSAAVVSNAASGVGKGMTPSANSKQAAGHHSTSRSRSGIRPPAIVRSSKQSSSADGDGDGDGEGFPAPPANLDDLPPNERRRYERNLREQQRSYKISQQIKELRDVLTESKIPFKPNKFSILLSVVEYIKQLQSRAVLLDAEHRKLVDTLRTTTDMVNSGRGPGGDPSGAANNNGAGSSTGASAVGETSTSTSGRAAVGNDAEMLFVQGLDYKSIFAQCSAALGVASLDGRFVACNAEFEIVSGYSREELARQSLFNLLTGRDMQEVFEVMGDMLKGANTAGSGGNGGNGSSPQTYWSGIVTPKRNDGELLMNITLARTSDGYPKFFNCALAVR